MQKLKKQNTFTENKKRNLLTKEIKFKKRNTKIRRKEKKSI